MKETIRRINVSQEFTLKGVIKAAMNHDYDMWRFYCNEYCSLVRHCELFDIVSFDDVDTIVDSFNDSKIRIWREYN